MGGCASSPLFKEQPLIEGELNAEAMRDPFTKEDEPETQKAADQFLCCGCLRDDTSCCRFFLFLLIIVTTNVLFQSTTLLTVDSLGMQMMMDIGCDVACQRALGGVGYAWVMGVAGLFAGSFADRVGHRPRALMLALVISSVFTGIGSAGGSFGALFAPRLVTAIASSVALPLTLPLLLDRAHMAGHLQYGGAVGILCLAFPLSDGLRALLDWFGTWRTAFATISAVGVVVALPLLALGEVARRDRKTLAPPPGAFLGLPSHFSARETVEMLFRSQALTLLLVSQLLLELSSSAIIAGVPGYFLNERATSDAEVKAGMDALSGTTFPLIVTAAVLSDTYVRVTGNSRIWVTVGLIAASVVLFLPAVYIKPSVDAPASNIFIVLYYLSITCPVAINYLNLIDAVPPQALGRVVGLHALIVRGNASFGPLLMDACSHGKVFNEFSPYQASMVFFGLVPPLLAMCAVVPAARLAAPCRVGLEVSLDRDATE